MPKRPPMILVSGGGQADDRVLELAEAVGRELARSGAIVLTGGLGGVMEAASRGAKAVGGTTVGIVPGTDNQAANAYVDIVITSGMSHGRNALLVHSADAVIALPGSFGTLSEVALALVMRKPAVSVGSWNVDPMVQTAPDAQSAVRVALGATGAR